jgi:hypothetical protein
MNKDYTHIGFVMDQSGSMSTRQMDVIGGFNTFLENQKATPGKCTFTYLPFSDTHPRLDPDYILKDLKEVEPLSRFSYIPKGTTALYDSIAYLVDETGKALSKLPETLRPGKVIICVQTDGEENNSVKYKGNWKAVADIISHQEKVYNWEFVFLGAGKEACSEGDTLSFAHAKSLSMGHTAKAYVETYSSLSNAVIGVRTGSSKSINFTDKDRKTQEEEGAYVKTK